MTDPVRQRSATLTKAMMSPLVLVPAIAGAIASAVAILLGSYTGWLFFAGVCGVVFAAGAAATQLIFRTDKLAQSVYEDSVKESRRAHEAHLTKLAWRLRRDRDDRTEEILDRLHRLYDRLHEVGVFRGERGVGLYPEISEKVVQLYWSCLKSLEQSWEFWKVASELSTPAAREQVLQRREDLLKDIQEGLGDLETTVDNMQTKQLQLGSGEQELTQIREELDTGLQVARRVEQRMNEFETGLATGPEKTTD